jgi:hypothetical protein
MSTVVSSVPTFHHYLCEGPPGLLLFSSPTPRPHAHPSPSLSFKWKVTKTFLNLFFPDSHHPLGHSVSLNCAPILHTQAQATPCHL